MFRKWCRSYGWGAVGRRDQRVWCAWCGWVKGEVARLGPGARSTESARDDAAGGVEICDDAMMRTPRSACTHTHAHAHHPMPGRAHTLQCAWCFGWLRGGTRRPAGCLEIDPPAIMTQRPTQQTHPHFTDPRPTPPHTTTNTIIHSPGRPFTEKRMGKNSDVVLPPREHVPREQRADIVAWTKGREAR